MQDTTSTNQLVNQIEAQFRQKMAELRRSMEALNEHIAEVEKLISRTESYRRELGQMLAQVKSPLPGATSGSVPQSTEESSETPEQAEKKNTFNSLRDTLAQKADESSN